MATTNVQSKCRALWLVNEEISARCRQVPALTCIKTSSEGSIVFTWKWKPKLTKLKTLKDEIWAIGPLKVCVRDLKEALPLVEKMENPAIEAKLLELLEQQQVELGKLELKCIQAQTHQGSKRLPYLLKHPYVGAVYARIKNEHGMKLSAFLLKTPGATIEQFLTARELASSWLALQLFGIQLISRWAPVCFAHAQDGIYLRQNDQEFVGFALRKQDLWRFRFEQVALHEFGNLELQQSKVAKLPVTLAQLTDDEKIQKATHYCPIIGPK